MKERQDSWKAQRNRKAAQKSGKQSAAPVLAPWGRKGKLKTQPDGPGRPKYSGINLHALNQGFDVTILALQASIREGSHFVAHHT
jgi:hypothetical protein